VKECTSESQARLPRLESRKRTTSATRGRARILRGRRAGLACENSGGSGRAERNEAERSGAERSGRLASGSGDVDVVVVIIVVVVVVVVIVVVVSSGERDRTELKRMFSQKFKGTCCDEVQKLTKRHAR